MQEVLHHINRCAGVLGSAVLGLDGVVAASDFREGVPVDDILRFAQEVSITCERIVTAAGRGEMLQALIEGPAGRLLVFGLTGGFLAVLADRHTNVGLLRLSVERAVSEAQQGPFDEKVA